MATKMQKMTHISQKQKQRYIQEGYNLAMKEVEGELNRLLKENIGYDMEYFNGQDSAYEKIIQFIKSKQEIK